jgi:hypothetical protein
MAGRVMCPDHGMQSPILCCDHICPWPGEKLESRPSVNEHGRRNAEVLRARLFAILALTRFGRCAI